MIRKKLYFMRIRKPKKGVKENQKIIHLKNIENLLIENSIQYIKEYKFKDLGEYRYDFYLPTLNRLIEFYGKQHFQECRGSWDENDNLE